MWDHDWGPQSDDRLGHADVDLARLAELDDLALEIPLRGEGGSPGQGVVHLRLTWHGSSSGALDCDRGAHDSGRESTADGARASSRRTETERGGRRERKEAAPPLAEGATEVILVHGTLRMKGSSEVT